MKKAIKLLALMMLLLFICGCGIGGGQKLEAVITPVKYDREAIVTIVSDDGNFESGIMYNELCKKNNIGMTIAGIGEWIEPNLEEWQAMEQEGKLEIISHSQSHIYMGEDANVSEEELQYQLTDSIRWFEENFTTDQIAFVPPEVRLSQRGHEIIDEDGIVAVRVAGDEFNYLSDEVEDEKLYWDALRAVSLQTISSVDQMNAWIDKAIEKKTWMIWMWHNVTESGQEGGYEELSYTMVDAHMSYIAQKEQEEKIWSAPFVEATKYVYERENATISAWYNGQNITVQLRCDAKPLKQKQMDAELTVKVALPMDIDFQSIVEKNPELNLKIISEETGDFLLFEVLPNSKTVVRV